ncbi:acyltransferase domain-containing protein [Kitasatospora sp. NPDC085879]|uniref:acyltransferase domain-containing protein n=1 Tax=Kitasatospora sp. NPDC085879 TaxID=3154769 RepID=UPI003425DCD5
MPETEAVPGPPAPAGPRPVALLLPGQGSQHDAMATGLYGWEPVFTEAMDTVFDALGAVGPQLRDDWLAECPRVPLDHVTRAQPLLFAVDHALARTVLAWGVAPVALLGHSVGELAAGVLAGVFDVRDAAAVLWDRAERLAALPPGGMLAVAATAAELAPFLREDVVVGAVNAPRQTMLAGSAGPLAAVAADLREAGHTCREVRATTAFHSPAAGAAVSTDVYAGVRLGAPRTELWSAYSTAPLTPELAADPDFWARHPVDPVLFGPALDGLLGSGDFFLLETGPGQSLAGLARRHARVRRGESAVTALLPAAPRGPEADREALRAAAARLRAEGHPLPGLAAG